METRIVKNKRSKGKKLRRSFIISLCLTALLLTAFYASYDLRLWLAGSILTTQHPQWAKYTLVGDEALDKLKQEIDNPEFRNSLATFSFINLDKKNRPLIEVVPVEKHISVTHYYKGHVMLVSDPDRVHLVQTIGKKTSKGYPRGEWLEEFSDRTKALGGVNASGFYDPNYMGLAPEALGLVMVDGEVIQDYDPDSSGETALGITFDGKLITGKYTSKELKKMKVRDAVSFKPQLIVDGKNLFKGKDATSWGLAPRTAVGQREDGTIVFAVIDGRQTHSIGASMTDMAEIMEEFGCVNAMAMDGGTSAMMVHDGKLLTKSANSDRRGRFIPNAWMVY